MNITKEFISSIAINDTAVQNGAGLAKKNKYTQLMIDKDQTFLSGACAGSGKNPYICSADFIQEETPVFRCSCPSRQIPCKHVIGLLWAFSEGQSFATMEIPEDILEKRENKEKRAIKAKEKQENGEIAKPKEKTAAWKKSAIKKIETQLAGIAEAQKLVQSILQTGLGAMDAKSIKTYEGIVKQLDSYFIPGIQNEFYNILGMIQYSNQKQQEAVDRSLSYGNFANAICRLHLLLEKSNTYLENKKEAPDKPDIESEIEELLGYPWKLDELAQHGLVETDVQLAQLCFHVRREDEKKQYIDEGFYISLSSGKIYKTRNYRPYKALKHIKEEDSTFSVLSIPRLYIYPSRSQNPRVRWETYTPEMIQRISPEICQKIKAYGHTDFAQVIKSVKMQLKDLMLFSHPVVLVQFEKIVKLSGHGRCNENHGSEDRGSEDRGRSPADGNQVKNDEWFALVDTSGKTIGLKESSYCQDSFLFLLDNLNREETEKNAMLLLFENNVETGRLFAQPLALVTDQAIVRLVY